MNAKKLKRITLTEFKTTRGDDSYKNRKKLEFCKDVLKFENLIHESVSVNIS